MIKGRLNHFFDAMGSFYLFCKEMIIQFRSTKGLWGLTAEQIYQIGYKSLPLVLISAIATGMVMTLQFGLGLSRFGGTLYVPRIVTLSIFREMGPVFTGLMLVARVTAGITSEVGSMAVTQQLDAIRALGTSPIQKIVLPRVLACLIVVPILVGIANAVGFLGGLIVGVQELGLDPMFYALKALNNLRPGDYLSGFGKAIFFALFISIPACHYGMKVDEGTRGVGKATTRAVVFSAVLILVGDFFLTKLFYILEMWF
jgi:phospholipid/cholesterol/gamma-HCH transport system permease protein